MLGCLGSAEPLNGRGDNAQLVSFSGSARFVELEALKLDSQHKSHGAFKREALSRLESWPGHMDMKREVEIALIAKRRSAPEVQACARLSRAGAAVGIHNWNGINEPIVAMAVARSGIARYLHSLRQSRPGDS
jgi:hypothetical protein